MQELILIKGYNVMNCPSGKTPLLCKEVTAAQTCWSLRLPCSKVSIKTCLLNDPPRRSFVTFFKMDSISTRALEVKRNVYFKTWSSWCCREANSSSQADFQTSCPCWAHLQKQPLLHVTANLEGSIPSLAENAGTKQQRLPIKSHPYRYNQGVYSVS